MKKITPIRIARKVEPRPLVSLCVMFRDNVDTIKTLLASVKDHFDEYVFCDTGSVDGTRQIVDGFCRENVPEGRSKVIDFEWCDDFAKARQANFEAATGVWRMFLDSDDELIDGQNLRQIITDLTAQEPQVRGVNFHYDYDVLEDLPTMRLVKWSRGWRWVDAIHERLSFDGDMPERGMARVGPKDLVVRHKRKTAEEKDRALRRNGTIARREYAATTDVEYKGRLARTIAMELKLDGKYDEAAVYLQEVADTHQHTLEGRQAYADMFRFAVMGKDYDRALDMARKAGPSYEVLAHHARKEWPQVIHRGAAASVAGQQTTHEGFLFEQVLAPVALAEAAHKLEYDAVVVEQVINTIRTDLRNHDSCRANLAALRYDIDRVTILVPSTPQPFDSWSTKAMLGGSEEAVVYLARALSKMGRNVRVFGVLPPTTIPGVDIYGIDWQPFNKFRLADEHGTLVFWRAVPLVYEVMRRKGEIKRRADAGDDRAFMPTGIGNASLWLHDRSTGVGRPEENAAIMSGVSTVVVLSEHHQRCIEQLLPADHKVNFVKLSNGIVGDDFEALMDEDIHRDPYRVIYSSCPSRGLVPLLEMWPTIKQACPEASLDIYYDWSMLRSHQPEVYDRVMQAYKAVQHLDVVHHGGVSHAELHYALRTANVWAYSHFENTDVETFCISAVKATAAGATVVTSRHGAIPEVAPDSVFADRESYAEAVIAEILNPRDESERLAKSRRAIERFDWNRVAADFAKVWTVRADEAPPEAPTPTAD